MTLVKISLYCIFKAVLSEIRLDPHDYGTHSFRRGGVSFALGARVSLNTISIIGDWRSDSIFLYLHIPLSQPLFPQWLIVFLLSHISTLP